MYKTHIACRACGYASPKTPGTKSGPPDKLVSIFNLGIQPLANDFWKSDEECAGFAPLEVMFCPKCTLGQLSVTVNPIVLYSKYSYVTSTSQMMRQHFELLFSLICEETTPSTVLEIGSNDGRLLSFMRDKGAERVVGIDPAQNLVAIAKTNGIPSVTGIFDLKSTDEAIAWNHDSRFSVVLARHVFCHVDDWKAFLRNLSLVSNVDTLVCIEAPYAADMLQRGEFDTIYHEHTSYLTIRAMAAALQDTDFHIHRVVPASIHGGAVIVMLRHNQTAKPAHPSAEEYLNNERLGLETWTKFATDCTDKIQELTRLVREAVSKGKRVVGYGASAKSTVCINACGFTRKDIAFVTDTTIHKLYHFIPGTDIPIVDEGALTRELPDYALLFAWNYEAEIVAKEKYFLSKGGQFIIPHPQVHVASLTIKV